MKRTIIIFAVALNVLFISCSTTGDPNSGGIFWSSSKAQKRLESLESENQVSQRALDQAKTRKSALNAQRESIKNQY